MKQYRRTQISILICLILYPIIALSTIGLPQRELFPFFSWELFSYIPADTITSYGIRFSSANSAPLEQPIYFEEAKHLTPHADSVDAFVTIQTLGNAIAQNEPEKITATRHLMQSTYFGDLTAAEYEIVRRRFDLLERWQHNRYLEEEALATFTFP